MPKFRAQHVVITGAAGHLGSHVLKAFRDAGWNARGVDLIAGRDVAQVDLRDASAARAALKGAQIIVHCAALPRPVGFDPDVVFATNMALMHSAVSAAVAENARFIYASSYSVIGLPFAPARPKLTSLPITESEPPAPQDVYALTKWLGEEMLESFARQGGTAVSLRLPWVHTAETFARDVLPIQNLLKSHIHLWSWIDASDAGRGFVAAAQAQITGHERMFISAAETFSTRPTQELACAGWPEVPLTPVLGHEALIDAAYARQILGFTPSIRWKNYEVMS